MEKRARGRLGAPHISLFIFIAGHAMCNIAMSVMMIQVIDEFQLKGAGQGLMNSVIHLGGFLSILAIPFLQGRVKKTVMMVVCGLLQVLGLAFTGWSASFALLLAACFLLGVGGGWADSYANSCMADLNTTGDPRGMGMLHGFYGLGSILTPLMIQGLLYLTGWRNVYLISAGIALAVALQFVVVARLHRAQFDAHTDSEERMTAAGIKAFLADKPALLLVLCALFYSGSQTGLVAWVVNFMDKQHGAAELGALAVSTYWLCSTVNRFLVPQLPLKPLWLVAGGSALAAAALFVGVLSGSPVLMVVMCGVNGSVSGHCIPMILHEAVGRYRGNTSLPTAAIMLACRVSMMGMPLAAGALSVLSMPLSMMLSGFCSLLTTGAALWAYGLEKRERGKAA